MKMRNQKEREGIENAGRNPTVKPKLKRNSPEKKKKELPVRDKGHEKGVVTNTIKGDWSHRKVCTGGKETALLQEKYPQEGKRKRTSATRSAYKQANAGKGGCHKKGCMCPVWKKKRGLVEKNVGGKLNSGRGGTSR